MELRIKEMGLTLDTRLSAIVRVGEKILCEKSKRANAIYMETSSSPT
jgi:hypothetical protein